MATEPDSERMLAARLAAIEDLAADLAVLDAAIRMFAKRGAQKQLARILRDTQNEWTEQLLGMRERYSAAYIEVAKAQRAWVTPDLSK